MSSELKAHDGHGYPFLSFDSWESGMSILWHFQMFVIYQFDFLLSFTTAAPVTTTTTAPPTQNPADQYIALQSLASKTVEAAQTGRMASSLNLDMVSIEVTDPEPPRKLPRGWTRATPAEGKAMEIKKEYMCFHISDSNIRESLRNLNFKITSEFS